jgi:hypothetical protein
VIASGFDGSKLGLCAYRALLWVMNRSKRIFVEGSNVHTWGIAPPASAVTLSAGAQASTVVSEFDSGWTLQWVQDNEGKDPAAERTLYDTGTVDTFSTATITGTDTLWTGVEIAGATIRINTSGGVHETTVVSVTDNTTLVIAVAVPVTESGLSYAILSTFAALTYDTVNKQSGTASVHAACWDFGIWRISRIAAADYRIGGNASNSDVFRFWFYASNPSMVNHIMVVFYDNNGSTASRWMTIDKAGISRALYSWTQVSIMRGLDPRAALEQNAEYREVIKQLDDAIASGNTLAADALAIQKEQLSQTIISGVLALQTNSADAFRWDQVTQVSFDFDVEPGGVDIHLDLAEFVGGLTASLVGEYTYYVTYANDFGHESNIGPGASITVDKQPVTLSAIPASPDPSTTIKHIYRVGGSINRPLRVATIANGTTSFADVYSNEHIENIGVDPPEDNAVPPAARGLLPEPYRGKLVCWSTAANPNRLFWSETGKPNSFPEENFDDIGSDGDELLIVTNHKNALWMYRRTSIWIYPGDLDSIGTFPVQSNAALSAVGANAVVNGGGFDLFVAPRGIYRFNGESESKFSDPLDPLFHEEYVDLGGGTLLAPVNQDAIATCALGLRGDHLYFAYPEIGQTQPNVMLACDLRTNTWARMTGALCNVTCMRDEGSGLDFLAGTAAGTVYEMEIGGVDSGAALALLWQSGYQDQGAPNNPKQYADVVIDGQTAFGGESAGNVTVDLVTDNGALVTNLGIFSSAARTQTVFRIANGDGLVANNAAIRISGNVSSTVQIYSATIHWYPVERRAKMFDTDVIDFGSEKLKSVEAVELDITATGAVDWKIFSDMPGAVMTQRDAGTITPGAGRRTVTVKFASAIEGKRFRLTLTGSSLFQLHGLHFRYRIVGDYYDGTDAFDSGPIDLRDVNLFRWLEIIADTGGAAVVELMTELPTGAMAVRLSATINSDTTTTDRATWQYSLPGTTRGQIVRVRITPSAGMRLYGVRIFARALGQNASDWRYIDSPALPVYQPSQALQQASVPV